MPTETWEPIPGFDGYEASDLGRIRSVDRVVFRNHRGRGKLIPVHYRGRLLNPARNSNGYMSVPLGVRTRELISHLVLLAFVGPPPDGQVACHTHGNKQDNRLINLRYDTRAANEHDKVRHGVSNRGERNGQAILMRDQVLEIRSSKMTKRALAARYGVSLWAIKDIKAGRNWGWL